MDRESVPKSEAQKGVFQFLSSMTNDRDSVHTYNEVAEHWRAAGVQKINAHALCVANRSNHARLDLGSAQIMDVVQSQTKVWRVHMVTN